MPDMNCTEFEARLMQAVESRRTLGDVFDEESDAPSEWRELRAQANACPHCRQLWNEFALLDRVLPVWKDRVPRVDLADAVITRWREEQSSGNHSSAVEPASSPEHHRKSGWSSLFSVLLAVAVLASVPLWFSFNTDEDLPPTIPIATDATNNEAIMEKVEPQVDVVQKDSKSPVDWKSLAQEAGSAYWVLASDAADSFSSVTVFVPPRKAAAGPPQPEEPEHASDWGVAAIGTGLKPIGQDVTRAMGFLFDALPGEEPTL